MKNISALICALMCLLLYAGCAGNDVSSSAAESVSSMTEEEQEAERERIRLRIAELTGIRDANAAAELIFRTVREYNASLAIENRTDEMITGVFPETSVPKLSSDGVQGAVKNVLNINRIELGLVSWETDSSGKPLSAIYKTNAYGYEGHAPEPAPYPGDAEEAERLLAEIPETELVTSAPDSTDDSGAPQTVSGLLELSNKNAQAVFEVVGEVYAKYVSNGGKEYLEDELIMMLDQNYGNAIKKDILNGLKARGIEIGILYVTVDPETKAPTFAQWGDASSTILGQYPDPTDDIEADFKLGEKLS